MRLGYWLDISHFAITPRPAIGQARGELEFRAGIFCHLLGLSKLLGLLGFFALAFSHRSADRTFSPGFFFDGREIGGLARQCGLGCFSVSLHAGVGGGKVSRRQWWRKSLEVLGKVGSCVRDRVKNQGRWKASRVGIILLYSWRPGIYVS